MKSYFNIQINNVLFYRFISIILISVPLNIVKKGILTMYKYMIPQSV